MNKNTNRIALVTGANSGIGYETSARLAEEGYKKIILAVRSVEKGEITIQKLVERTNQSIFDYVVIDTSNIESSRHAANELISRAEKLDLLVLNAGMSPKDTDSFNDNGIEMTFASHIIGHHVFAMSLLNNSMLSQTARIIIAGSEGATGKVPVPGMGPVDVEEYAANFYNGDLARAMSGLMRNEQQFDPMNKIYPTVKTFSVWWAAVLARKLPEGMKVNAVSPGSVPTTGYIRNVGFLMRKIMPVMMKIIPGMSHSISKAAERYSTVGSIDFEETGKFYASKLGKVAGKMYEIDVAHFSNRNLQELAWTAIVENSGVDYQLEIRVAK